MFGKSTLPIRKVCRYVAASCMIVLALLLVGCGKKEEEKKKSTVQTVIEVKLQQYATPLYFNGTIEPLEVFNVISPVEGVINKAFFRYGQVITKDQKLFSLSSEKLEEEYITTISNYLKALDDYSEKKRKFEGTKELWRLKFISSNDYHADKISMQESFFGYRQAARKLDETLTKIGIKEAHHTLDLHNPKVVEKIVSKKLQSFIMTSPYNGIALDLKSLSTSDQEKEKQKVIGSEVKQGDILIGIGDLSGISVLIKVNEVDVNLIQKGQKAVITGPGFSEFALHGVVSAVDSQAKSEGGGLPSFPVKIKVTEITPEQAKVIRVGMSAKVEIKIDDKQAIFVPLAAVFQEKGIDKIKVKKADSIVDVPVVVGKTTTDSIEIEKGLVPGDKIVVNH